MAGLMTSAATYEPDEALKAGFMCLYRGGMAPKMTTGKAIRAGVDGLN